MSLIDNLKAGIELCFEKFREQQESERQSWRDMVFTYITYIEELQQINLKLKDKVKQLFNLLAGIHGDGGHHTIAVGLEQSVKDAHDKRIKLIEAAEENKNIIANLYSSALRYRIGGKEVERLESEIKRLQIANDGQKEAICNQMRTIQRFEEVPVQEKDNE